MSFFSLAQPTVDSNYLRVNGIYIKGNEKTKAFIITRELTFQQNDSIPETAIISEIERSKNNLMNTALFNFVDLKHVRVDSSTFNVIIEVIERWYFWPLPIFELAETNFNTWWLNKDFSRINYGTYLVKENFRGRRETIKFKFQWGFTQNIGFQYAVPYINKKKTLGVSGTFSFAQNHEVNYQSVNNKRIFYKDVNQFLKQEYFARIATAYRSKLYNTHTFELDYVNASINDTLTVLSSDFFKDNRTRTNYFGINYWFRHDKRDYASYPLKGHRIDFFAKKYGLGTSFENQLNLMELSTNLTYHLPLAGRFYAAAGLFGKTTLFDVSPYFIQKGLGYSEVVRSYEYYVVDGQHYGLFKSNIKYQIIKPKVEKVDILNKTQFNTIPYALYFNVFFDSGYVVDDLYASKNKLANSLLLGTGIGIDLVTYYDMVIRTEFSMNRMGESGFFLNFVKAI